MRNKDFPEKKDPEKTVAAITLSLGLEATKRLKEKAKENGLTATGYVRNWIMGKPEYAADIEHWIDTRAQKKGITRRTVIERVLFFAMETERGTGKNIV